jgi:hypothetical protein
MSILLSIAWTNKRLGATGERNSMTTNAQMPTGGEFNGTARPGERPPGIVNRYSPAVQVGIVAAAIIPTVVIYVGWWLIPVPDDTYQFVAELAVFQLLYGLYFLGVIWFVSKNPQRRLWALSIAFLTIAYDTAVSCLAEFRHLTVSFYAYAAITVAYVAVWGIARRQSKAWVFGLPFAAIVSWFAQVGLLQQASERYWWEPWTALVGSFIIGCLLCWAFDAVGRRLAGSGGAPKP